MTKRKVSDKTREARIRRIAARQGMSLRKSRSRIVSSNDFGDYMVVNDALNAVVVGAKFDCTLDDLEEHFGVQA